jgi:hypothetical protein
MLTRRQALPVLATPPLLAVDGWTDLFNGHSIAGWKASGNASSWRVEDGLLVGDGPTSHLFHTGADLTNFELEVEVLTQPGSNSGVYFHTAFQEQGFPKKGFEVQVNNTAAGEGNYRERKRTGSLYGIRNVYKQLARDLEWTRLRISVRGKNVQVWVNGLLTVDYTEPTPAVLPPSQETGRFLDKGTFALQCHDAGSQVRYRSIRVRPLPATPAASTFAADLTYRNIIALGAKNYPLVDWHVHFKTGFGLQEAMERSRRDGIQYGVSANCGRQSQFRTDEQARAFVNSVKGESAFVGMQAEGGDWMKVFSRETCASFDYIFNDGMIWTDDSGRWTRLYRPEDLGPIADAEKFMEDHVERVVRMLTEQPLDIYAIPTYLPPAIDGQRAKLWTPARLKRVAEAAAQNGVAIELSDRFRLPSEDFIRLAQQAGAKFALGTGNSGAEDLRRSEYGLEMIQRCKLGWQDFFVPGAWRPRAIDRKWR